LVAVSTLLLCACGDGTGADAGAPTDAGVGDGAVGDAATDAATSADAGGPTDPWFDSPAPPVAPMIDWLADDAPPVAPPVIPWLADGQPPVAPPVLTPCPAGWTEITVDGVAACHPYSVPVATCGPGQAHFLGGSGCEEVGDACPVGGSLYSPTLPTDGTPIVYVASGGTGTGGIGDPLGSIQAALDGSASGTVIAIGPGTFREEITPRDGMTLHGACASRTIIRPPPPATLLGIIEVLDGRFHVSNLTLAGTRPALVSSGYMGGSPHVTAHGVYATGAIVAAVVANAGGVLDGDRVVVRATQPLPVDIPSLGWLEGQFGAGLDANTGGQVSLREVVIEQTYVSGISAAAAGTLVHLEDAAIRDTRPQDSDGLVGTGLLQLGGTVELLRTHVSGNATSGLFLAAAAARTTLTDVVVEGQVPDRDGFGGAGITAVGGTLDADRLLVRDNRETGIDLDSSARLDLRDVIVADTQLDGMGGGGSGASSAGDANLSVTRGLFSGNRQFGVLANNGELAFTDVRVRNTLGTATDDDGTGILGNDSSDITLERVVVEGNRVSGIGARGGTLSLTDVAVLSTIPEVADGTGGNGLSLFEGATATADRVLVDDNATVGMSVAGMGTRLDGRDVVVRDTQLDSSGGRGYGLLATSAGTMTLERVALSRNHTQGAGVVGATMELTDAVIEDTLPDAEMRLGEGGGTQGGGTLRMTRAIVRRNLRSGLYAFGDDSRIELTDVLVAETDSELMTGLTGLGLVIQIGASGALSRVLFDANRHLGMAVSHSGTVVTASDIVVRDTASIRGDQLSGRGVNLQTGASLTIERVAIERCRDTGFSVFGDDTTLTLSDLSVTDIAAVEATGIGGWGLTLGGVTGTVQRVRIERAHATGLLVTGGADLVVEDVAVIDTAPVEADSSGGRGLNVQNGAHATFTRTLISGNHELGVFVDSPETETTFDALYVRDTQSRADNLRYGGGFWIQLGAHAEVRNAIFTGNRYAGVSSIGLPSVAEPDLTLEDVVVYQTLESECVETGDGCPAVAGGVGIGSYGIGAVRATRFRVLGNALCGVQVAGDANLDLTDGEVSENAIGACIQVEDYDRSRLATDVIYRMNDMNIVSTTLPVPSAAESLSDLPTLDDR